MSANPFTARRWNRNPFQMWLLVFMLLVSTNQVLFIHPSQYISEAARQATLSLAMCNIIGGAIVFVGLHLREKSMALWIELCGYAALIGSLGIYVYIVWRLDPGPVISYGLGFSEAFVLASLHRGILITIDKFRHRRRWRRHLAHRHDRLTYALVQLEEERRRLEEDRRRLREAGP